MSKSHSVKKAVDVKSRPAVRKALLQAQEILERKKKRAQEKKQKDKPVVTKSTEKKSEKKPSTKEIKEKNWKAPKKKATSKKSVKRDVVFVDVGALSPEEALVHIAKVNKKHEKKPAKKATKEGKKPVKKKPSKASSVKVSKKPTAEKAKAKKPVMAKKTKAKVIKKSKPIAKKASSEKKDASVFMSGQSGPKIKLEESKLTEKEAKVLSVVRGTKGSHAELKNLGDLSFPGLEKTQANSWVRNSLRRLVRGSFVKNIGKGQYRAL